MEVPSRVSEVPPPFSASDLLAATTELLQVFEPVSVRALLHAACSSPTARQSQVSCVALLHACWLRPPSGSKVATAGDLATLVADVRAAVPGLAGVEDCVPLDPRAVVHFRARSGARQWTFRVHPGSLESPLQALQEVADYAEVLDPVLTGKLGCGLADMLEVAGRMFGRELPVLAPVWGADPVSLESPPTVSEAELAAADEYLKAWSLDELLQVSGQDPDQERVHPEQLKLAAAALKADVQDLTFAVGIDRAHLGPVLFVKDAANLLPVPAGLVAEGLLAAVNRALHLLPIPPEPGGEPGHDNDHAVVRRPSESPITVDDAGEAARRWRDRAWSDLAWACRSIPATILFGELPEDGHELLLIGPGQRHVVAVDLVTGLTGPEVAASVQAARERLAEFGPGSLFRVSAHGDGTASAGLGRAAADGQSPPEGTTDEGLAWVPGAAEALPFPSSLLSGEPASVAEATQVTRLIVVKGPWQHGPQWIPGIPACTLDEFRALLTAQEWESTDREELWSFLDEMTTLGGDEAGHGFAELICWSILDAWDAWRAHSMLCPAWVQEGAPGCITPRDLDLPWARDAALDRVDALLASVGMGGTREWSQLIPTVIAPAHADSDEQSLVVTLWLYQPRKGWWVCPDEDLIVAVDLEFHDGLTFSRAVMGTLANAIEDTLRQLSRAHPEAWDVWRHVHDNGPAVIQLTPAQLPHDFPAIRFVSLGQRFSQLALDPALLEGLSTAQTHSLIGEALTFALLARMQHVRTAHEPHANADEDETAGEPSLDSGDTHRGVVIELSPSGEDIERAEVFRAGWESIRPRFVQRKVETPFPPYSLTSPQTLTDSGQTRARRTIARRLAGQLAPGSHPLTTVLTQLCPGALQALSDAADRFNSRGALAAACAELERALSERFTVRTSLELNLESPWADETITDLDVTPHGNQAQRSRVADLLVECLLHMPPSGSLTPDKRDVHHLLDLAAAGLHASLEAQYAYAALRPARLEISELGDVEIVPAGSAKVDTGAWRRAEMEGQARIFASQADELPNAGEPPKAPGRRLADDEAEERGNSLRSMLEDQASTGTGYEALNAQAMLKVEDRLRENCGFGLDSVRSVLSTLASWEVPGEPFPPIAKVSRGDLVDNVVTWSGLSPEEIEAAVNACTLNAARIQEEGFNYWQLEHRSARLALRPVIEPPSPEMPGELWVLPRSAHRTQHLVLTYLNDRRLPWPEKDLPKPVRAAVREWRQVTEDALEDEAAKAAKTAGLKYRPKLTISKAASQDVRLVGEVDLLAADPVRRRIWVVEAKHLRQAFSPLEMAFHIADFHGPDALAIGPGTNEFRQFRGTSRHPYVQRILANADAVRRNIGGALGLINPSSSGPDRATAWSDGGDWQVIELAVTSHTEIAAFVTEPKVPFVAIDYLSEMFAAGHCPPPGWWAPWHHETG